MVETARRPLRLLLFSQNYAPEPTGIGKYSGELGAWLARRGHRVEVIAAVPHYPEWRVAAEYERRRFVTESIDGVTVHRVPVWLPGSPNVSTRLRIALESSFSARSTRWWLPRLVARVRPDVAIVVCPPTQSMLWPTAFATVRRVPYLVHFQDLQVDAALSLGMIRNEHVGRLLTWLETGLMRRATHVTTISHAMLAKVRAKGVPAERSSFFPNWSRLDAIHPMAPDPEVRARLGAEPGDILCVYSGSIGEKQGLEVLLAAATRLASTPHLKFAIVGNGAYRQRLESRAAQLGATIRFHDLFPSDELPALLAAGDIHLVVQRREAADLVMPSKLTNILASGRPCIATADAATEIGHVLRSAACGDLVPPDDAERLAAAIEELARAAPRRAAYGERARRYAEAELDQHRVLARFEALLERVAGAGGQAPERAR